MSKGQVLLSLTLLQPNRLEEQRGEAVQPRVISSTSNMSYLTMTVAGFALEESHQICVATPAFSNSNTAQLEATGWLMSDQIPTQLNSCNLHLAGGDSLLPHPRSWLDEAPGDPQQRERGWVAGAALPSTVSALPQLLGNPEINFIGRTKKTQTCRNMLCEKSLESAISIRLEPPRAEQDRTNEPQH